MSDGVGPEADNRRSGELTARELLRWAWRQLTSMRTALILLLLLAVAAIPGSIIPQDGIDALSSSQWKDAHPQLTPIYERLGLFNVFSAPWFSAIYVLLMVSLIGCIVPRLFVYFRAMRAQPPAAPRNLSRLPDHAAYTAERSVEEVLEQARAELKRRGYRLRGGDDGGDAVSAERGYLREAGNLLFHFAVVVVLVGFALGSLFGYKGGVILLVGTGFTNQATQYDDLDPGSLFSTEDLDPAFLVTVDDFEVEWLESGPRQGMSRGFSAQVRYQEDLGSPEQTYDLRVNHPLSIGGTDIFLIGHGYAPRITIKDGNGDVAFSGPTVFLPQDQGLLSFGVVKVPDAKTGQIGLDGLFFPTYVNIDGDPVNVMGDLKNPTLSMQAWTGDLGLDDGSPQSVYVLDKETADPVLGEDGKPIRIDLQLGNTYELPHGLGSVTFDGVDEWTRLQVSRLPGTQLALTGVVLALLGLLGSLFIRPRRIWVRARRENGVTLVEAAALDRSGGGDVAAVLDELVSALQGGTTKEKA